MLKFVCMILAVSGLLAAADGDGSYGCSTFMLRGTYGFIVTGTRPSGPPPAALEQMVGVSLRRFDGSGHWSGVDNIHGAISGLAPDNPGAGTYSINDDCSGTMTLVVAGTPPLELRFVLVDNGREIRAAVMAPAPVMVTAIGRRL